MDKIDQVILGKSWNDDNDEDWQRKNLIRKKSYEPSVSIFSLVNLKKIIDVNITIKTQSWTRHGKEINRLPSRDSRLSSA